MRLTLRNLILVSIFSLAAGCGIFNSNAEGKHSAEKVVRGNLEGASVAVDVKSSNGSIWVRSDPKAQRVSIEAIIQVGGKSDSEAKKRLGGSSLVSEVNDGTVRVRLKFPEPSFDEDGGRITIIVPHLKAVTAKSTNGRISISNSNGTSDVTTTNGAVEMVSCTADVKATTTNGQINVKDCLAKIELNTTNGNVIVRQALHEVLATTQNGSLNVYCGDAGSGPVHLKSSNDDVKLEIAQAFRGSIQIRTSNGDIEIIDPKKRAKMVESESSTGAVVMSEGDESTIKTTNGTVEVVIR